MSPRLLVKKNCVWLEWGFLEKKLKQIPIEKKQICNENKYFVLSS